LTIRRCSVPFLFFGDREEVGDIDPVALAGQEIVAAWDVVAFFCLNRV